MNKLFYILVLGVFVSGCTTIPVVQPTFEEYEAAKVKKRTVVVTEISELGSEVEGINELIISKLESAMVNNFNVVERTHLGPMMAEREFQTRDDVQQQVEFGRIMGADFVIYGSSVASFIGPKVKTSKSKDKDGNFFGTVWEEISGQAEVTIKVVDVRNGVIHSSFVGNGRSTEKLNTNVITDPEEFNRVSSLKSLATGAASVEDEYRKIDDQNLLFLRSKQTTQHRTKIVSKEYHSLDQTHGYMISRAINDAVNNISNQLIRKYGGLDAEVLQVVSDTEVMINIGSAFGVRPGMRVTVWSNGRDIVDPRTGVVLNSRVKKGTLKVQEVTSGLSCIAKGSKDLIQSIRRGDYVTLNQ